MADDIATPMILVPQFRHIYVIDLFDKTLNTNNGTLDNQRDVIKSFLLDGTDANKQIWYWNDDRKTKTAHGKWYNDIKTKKPSQLKSKSIITNEVRTLDYWRLDFDYEGLPRTLCVYTMDFLTEWPTEIRGVDHVMMFGAYGVNRILKTLANC